MSRSRVPLAVFSLLAAAVLWAMPPAGIARAAAAGKATAPTAWPKSGYLARFDGTLIVAARDKGSYGALERRLAADGARVVKRYGWERVAVRPPAGTSVREYDAHLSSLPGVEYAEPPALVRALGEGRAEAVRSLSSLPPGPGAPSLGVRATAVPDDPFYVDQWGLDKISAPTAWEKATGDGVVVAVVDTGVQWDHVDLAGNVVPGLNVLNGSMLPTDGVGHGTHVAGIVAEVTDNGIGGAGTAPSATVLAVRVLDDQGEGTEADVAEGIMWAADNGADVINLSMGTPTDTTDMRTAVEYALGKDVAVVAAAGNYDPSSGVYLTTRVYPAAYTGVIGVGATQSDDTRASFSVYSPGVVDVSAPGSGIWSTYPPAHMAVMSGTSMASPFVSGVSALVLSVTTSMTPDELETVLETTSEDISVSGRDDYTGWGRIDADRAVAAVTEDVYEPDDTTATAVAGGRVATLSATYSHTYHPYGESDFKYADLEAGRVYRAFTQDLAVGADTHLSLLSADGTTVLTSSDDVSGSDPSSSLVHTATVAGRYFVKSSDDHGLGGMYVLGFDDITAARHTSRIADDDRYSTAGDIAAAAFPGYAGMDDLVVAAGEDAAAADSLSAAGLCWLYDAPLLLTRGTSLSSQVRDAIVSAPASVTVHVVGGTPSVSSGVYSAIAALPNVGSIERISAGDRYGIAEKVAARLEASSPAPPDVALVANGADFDKFTDAIALSAVSAAKGYPILLVSKDRVPNATRDSLSSNGYGTVIVAGGTATVSSSVYGSVGADDRWYGADRYDTALDIAEGAIGLGWLDDRAVGIAAKIPDALTGGAFLGTRLDGPILATRTSPLSSQVETFLDAHRNRLERVHVLGGSVSVSSSAYNRVVTVLSQ